MMSRLLLDTHIAVRRIIEGKGLTRDQIRELDAAERRSESVALSTISLLEIAFLIRDRKVEISPDLLKSLELDFRFEILPISAQVALEAAALHSLRDPFDQVIVASAGVHRLKLVTSDLRIIDSQLVPVIE